VPPREARLFQDYGLGNVAPVVLAGDHQVDPTTVVDPPLRSELDFVGCSVARDGGVKGDVAK